MEKAYKYEKPCQMEKAYEYEKPCKVEKAYKYEKPCQYEKEATCEKKMPCGYKMEKKMDCGRNYDWMDGDMDSRMEKGYSCGRMYKEYPQRRMMEREESQYSCRYDFVKNSPCEEKQTKSYSDWNDCCKYGVISEDCYDRDYMDYTPKMYRGCFKKAKDCPCD